MKISNCCNAKIVEESYDVCSNCKEHCKVILNTGEDR